MDTEGLDSSRYIILGSIAFVVSVIFVLEVGTKYGELFSLCHLLWENLSFWYDIFACSCVCVEEDSEFWTNQSSSTHSDKDGNECECFVSDTEHKFVIVLLTQPLFKGDINEDEDNLELLHVEGFETVTLLEYFPLSEIVFKDDDTVIEEGDEDHDQLFSNKTQLLSVLFMFEVCVTLMLGFELDENAYGLEFIEHSDFDLFGLLDGQE